MNQTNLRILKKQKHLNELLKTGNVVTRNEIEAIAEYIFKILEEKTAVSEQSSVAIQKMLQGLSKDIDDKEKSIAFIDSKTQNSLDKIKSQIKDLELGIKEVEPPITIDEDVLVEKIFTLIKPEINKTEPSKTEAVLKKEIAVLVSEIEILKKKELSIEDIIKKINNLPKDSLKIDSSKIKNLPENRPRFGGFSGIRQIVAGTNITIDESNQQYPKINAFGGGGGGSYTFITGEVPSGTINGINNSFSITNTPITGTVKLYLNGLRMTNVVDYSVSGTTILTTTPPQVGDIFLADYVV